MNHAGLEFEALPCEVALEQGFDCGVITTGHPEFDYAAIAERSVCLVDTCNALRGLSGDHIRRL